MYSTKEARESDRYIKEYGEKQFFEDLDMYEEILGKTWDEITAEEQTTNPVAIHKKALVAIQLKQAI
ncbi:MAG: hypothetical protein LBC86_04995 [Oscillospiraceae bacterium]|jgi:hypothetical protein|nr:hypothetical protein [Oscillospiraceae bacterium]